MISMNQIWDETVAYIRREAALLVPLVLATVYLADVIGTIVGTLLKPGSPNSAATVAMLAVTLWSIVGQLAIASLVLAPGRSVGEALKHAMHRLGKVMVVGLVLGLAISIALTPVLVAAIASGADPANPASFQALPAWVLLLSLAAIGCMIWLGIRLALMNALIVDQNPGVVDCIKQSFALTQGIGARLFVVALLYGAMLVILSSAVKFVAGSIFALLGAAMGSVFAGQVMTALVAASVTAALSLISAVFLAKLYIQVAPGQRQDALRDTFS